jgi:phosphotransferase family enzyme
MTSMGTARSHILQKYHISPGALLNSGMEAEVYAYGPDAVLKLYAGTVSLAELLALQGFYCSLDRQLVPYAFPNILTVAEEGCFLVTIEQRLEGVRMSDVLPALTTDQLDATMERYLTAALAVSQIQVPPALDRHKLFDPDRISYRGNGDWHQFLVRYLYRKLPQVTRYLSRDVPQFAAKVRRLFRVLDPPYCGDYRLIHGDFFPGNLLVDDDHQVVALLDFGLLTMVGDYLFDLATGWVFFDMYDALKARARDRYLGLLLDRLGERVRGRLYRYVLIYSILSANTYSSTCADGHYRWCVANLCNQSYWQGIE